ncbi:MAG: hypothetical protein EXS31_04940 [Pedosphaera sp.]|nr:hypothetical protein [Pedosphaera sp.]
MKLLQSSWVVALLGGLLYLGVTAALWKTPVQEAKEEITILQANQSGPSWDFTNPEVDQLILELKKEKEELDKREHELKDLATRLMVERMELNRVTQTVHSLQMDLDKSVIRIQEEETANLKKLARTYAAMAPDSASLIMRELDEPTVARIMVFMKEDEAAPLLEALARKGDAETRRAASISEKLRLATFRKPIDKNKTQ